ncbi:hypothetical protein V6O07_11945, partial [Arthrospira platensis SPKY2]
DFSADPEESGMRSLSSINQLLERKRMGNNEVLEDTTPVMMEEGTDVISAGGRTFERPESVTPSMLDTIRSKMGES